MSQVAVKVFNNSSNELPKYAHPGDSGVDLYANEAVLVGAKQVALINTELYVAIPEGFEIQVRSRSGLALKKGVFVLNSPGTVDSGYRNQIGVILFNTTSFPIVIEKGDKIAQAVLCPVFEINWDEVKSQEELETTSRNLGGFGSTGT